MLLATILFLCATQAGDVPSARWELSSDRPEVGEPVRARLSLEHDAAGRAVLATPTFDESWVVFAPAVEREEPLPGGRIRTVFEFELAALEAGKRALPEVSLALSGAACRVEPQELDVRSALAEGEDAPRPMRGLPPLPAEAAASRWPLIAGVLALAALALVLVLRRWRARAPAALSVPAPSARLAVIEAAPLERAEDVAAAHAALARLLREAGDLRAGRDRSALTDQEWRAAARAELEAAGLGAEDLAALVELFVRAEEVKYGPERPTHWATRERLARARSLAARLEPAPSGGRPSTPSGRKEAAA